jgi:lipoprotein-anchoring transpeptidase ErfK/SrfK
MRKGCRRYYRTQANGFIPFERIILSKWSDFRGVSLDGSEIVLPVGYLMSRDTPSFALDKRGRLQRKDRPGYHYVFRIAAEEQIRGQRYYRSMDDKYFLAKSVTRIDARPRPAEVADDEKWIDVDLGLQSLVAYHGDQPVYATLVSSGRINNYDPSKNYETPSGNFTILSKYLTHTMDGDHAVDGPYSIEDVPYVMYFQMGYALHSAFWHDSFGRPHSHGCLNLAPWDAKWVFNWATPTLPIGWHASFPTKERPGTRLYVHGDTPGKKVARKQ